MIALLLALTAPPADRPVLRVAYFTPTDRTPEPDRVARLGRVMTEVQRFYRVEMERLGHGPLTFELDRDAAGKLTVRDVRAKGPTRDYGRNSGGAVRAEVKAALAADGLDLDREHVVIFQQLLEWQGAKAVERGSYVGGGGPRSGTAWVYDDAKLDPELLPSKQPGGYYNGPCSLGQFNTHYVGGVVHELGHALGLPHDCERASDLPRLGRSLMGGGNHTYGRERRGDGPGAFLSPASGLPLTVHPLFTGKRVPAAAVTAKLAALAATAGDGLVLKGKFAGGGVVGVVAHNDPAEPSGDYDAVGAAGPVAADGSFTLTVDLPKPGPHELRLTAYAASGDSRTFKLPYPAPDLRPVNEAVPLLDAHAAFRAKDRAKLTALAKSLKQPRVNHLLALLDPPAAKPLPAAGPVMLADVRPESATVGWLRPERNRVPAEGEASCLLEVGGQFFASGLYAHAPAVYRYRVGGRARLTAKYGLQDGHDGSVVFVVRGDGKELFRSKPVRDHVARELSVAVAGVDVLELATEDAGDGANGDWGVWLDPRLN